MMNQESEKSYSDLEPNQEQVRFRTNFYQSLEYKKFPSGGFRSCKNSRDRFLN